VSAAGRLLVVLLIAAGCGGDDDGSDGDGSGGDAGAVTACPDDLAGPAMVAVPSPDGPSYCIDATEVTSAQYQAFLDAQADVEQPERCGENESFEPDSEVQCEGAYDPAARPDFPASCMDWCDAWSYCAWAGKHLCGRIGGGPLGDEIDLDDASINEWFNACSSMGENEYAYGDSYEVGTCNAGPDTFDYCDPPAEVGSFADCRGTTPPFDQLFDMSGNVSEWIDACDDGAGVAPYCWETGGGSDSRSLSDCRTDAYVAWNATWWSKGFRCCWSPDDGG